jgi:hypothetical protein
MHVGASSPWVVYGSKAKLHLRSGCSSCCMSPAPHALTLLRSRYLRERLIFIAITGRMFLAAPICKSTRLRNLEASFPRAWLHEDQEAP